MRHHPLSAVGHLKVQQGSRKRTKTLQKSHNNKAECRQRESKRGGERGWEGRQANKNSSDSGRSHKKRNELQNKMSHCFNAFGAATLSTQCVCLMCRQTTKANARGGGRVGNAILRIRRVLLGIRFADSVCKRTRLPLLLLLLLLLVLFMRLDGTRLPGRILNCERHIVTFIAVQLIRWQ